MDIANSTQHRLALGEALGHEVAYFHLDTIACCRSTNAQLLAEAPHRPSGTVLTALAQTQGRGRLGRHWWSSGEDSLTFSLLWRFSSSTALTGLTLAVGVAVVEGLETLGIDGLALKWPNDIWRHRRKLAGLLVEVNADTVVIGVGLNRRISPHMPQALREAAAALDGDLSIFQTQAAVLTTLRHHLQAFEQGYFAQQRARWMSLCGHMGQTITVRDSGVDRSGRCVGIDIDGALLLETPSGVQRVMSGDVGILA
jgi:BirA family biotin operon repressor/biotin-[acetyl-CoA-carboxylase] ligase